MYMGVTSFDLFSKEQIARRGSLDGHVKIKAKPQTQNL